MPENVDLNALVQSLAPWQGEIVTAVAVLFALYLGKLGINKTAAGFSKLASILPKANAGKYVLNSASLAMMTSGAALSGSGLDSDAWSSTLAGGALAFYGFCMIFGVNCKDDDKKA